MYQIAPEGKKLRDLDPWDILYDARERGTFLEARIKRTRYIGEGESKVETWMLNFLGMDEGITGIISASQTGLPAGAPMKMFENQLISCKVVGIDQKNELVACSRKDYVDINKARLIRQLEVGKVITATVRAVGLRNVYVEVIGGGVIVRLDPDKVRLSAGVPLDIQYQVDSEIKIKVSYLNKEDHTLEVEPVDPWEKGDFAQGETLSGCVVVIRDNVAYVAAGKGIFGRAYYSRNDRYKEGDDVQFQVQGFDKEKRHLHLIPYDKRRVAQVSREKSRRRRKAGGGQSTAN